MSLSFSKRNQQCCTCVYWTGTRKITLGYVDVEDSYVQGQCCNSKSSWVRLERYADSVCDKWKSMEE